MSNTVERETFETSYHGCDVAVVTELGKDGRWDVVVNLTQDTGGAVRIIPVPLPEPRDQPPFGSREEATEYGLAAARRWFVDNQP